jgi:BTB/POZ domain
MSEPNNFEKLLNESSEITDIRLSMVNADHCADVTFTFPSHNRDDPGDGARSSVKAHKAFLISASPVFFTMFCGSLPPPTNEVAIDDICREYFMEVLRFIYADSATINDDNVYGIWYAAQKYMLKNLITKCEKHVCERINSTNAMDVFNSIQLFDNRDGDKKCLDIVFDSPTSQFKDIVKLNKSAFSKFIQRPELNCSVEFLKEVALKWLSIQKKTKFCSFSDQVMQIFQDEYKIQPMTFEKNKRFIPGLNVHYLDGTIFENLQYDRVLVDSCDSLYGIGIYVGIDPDDPNPAGNLEWLVIKVRQGNVELQRKAIRVRQKRTVSILRIMFEEIKFCVKMSITIRFPDERRRAINRLSVNKKKLCGKLSLPNNKTCIAYLIDKPDE